MEQIESHIPAPKPAPYRRYPFAQMKPGDSVFFDGIDHDDNAVHAAKRYFKRTGKKMTARKENGGIRIWNVE